MGRITIEPLDFEAVWARPGTADAALPGARQEPIAFRDSAAANELAGGRPGRFTGGILIAPLTDIADAPPQGRTFCLNYSNLLAHFNLELPLFRGQFNIVPAHSARLNLPFCNDLIGREEALLAIQKYCLAMGEVGLVQEGVRADGVQEGARPACAAVHAVGILQTAAHVGLDTLHAGLLMTLVALHLFSYHGGICVGTDGTGRGFHDFILRLVIGSFRTLSGFLDGLWLWLELWLWDWFYRHLPLQS